MVNSVNTVFEIDDLRKYILTFLRKEPKKKCTDCNCVLVWDKKVKDFISIGTEVPLFYVLPGYYCWNCYSEKTKMNCNLI
jgi:hypothetical protein